MNKTQFKVVCNHLNCWTRNYDEREKAETAAKNHTKRLGHHPIYIYEIKDGYNYVSSELLNVMNLEVSEGIKKVNIL